MPKTYCSKGGTEFLQDANALHNCPLCRCTTVSETPSISKRSKGRRPQGVTVLSILSIIGGLIAMIFGLIVSAVFSRGTGLGGMIGMFFVYLTLLGVISFFGGLFSLFLGWGLWEGLEWAWTLQVILEILGLTIGIAIIPYGLVIVLLCGLFLYYLFKPNVKTWFETEALPITSGKIELSESKLTKKAKELYGQLLYACTQFYGGRTRQVLEDKIDSLMKEGLSREEAILRLAQKERLIET